MGIVPKIEITFKRPDYKKDSLANQKIEVSINENIELDWFFKSVPSWLADWSESVGYVGVPFLLFFLSWWVPYWA